MNAGIGDRIVIRGHQIGENDRHGVVVEIRGSGGTPPYVVRWSDGHEALLFPGSDAAIQHRPGRARRTT